MPMKLRKSLHAAPLEKYLKMIAINQIEAGKFKFKNMAILLQK